MRASPTKCSDGSAQEIQWVQSYVTDNHFYCVYLAPDAQMIRDHAMHGGFPADRIMQVHAIVDPTTADEPVAVG